MATQRRATGWFSRALIIRTFVCLGLLVLPAAFPLASAAFAGSTASIVNSASTDSVAPPSGLSVVQTCSTVPAPVLRAVSPTASGSPTLVITKPAGVVQNDLLLAQIANRNNTYVMTPPAGWVALREDTEPNLQVTSRLYYKVATAGEPASYTFTLSNSVQMVGHIAAYSGVSTSNPVDVHQVAYGNSTTASTPVVTTTKANTMVVHLIAKVQENLPAPGGTTARWSGVSGNGAGYVGASAGDVAFAGPGAVAARTATSASNFSTEWIGQTVALRPVAGTPSASATWTASPSTWATGYRLERSVGATVQATGTVTPITATGTTDGPLVNGTTYAYRLWAYSGTWTSTVLSTSLTPSC